MILSDIPSEDPPAPVRWIRGDVVTTDAGLMPLVMQLGRTRASTIDVGAVLASVCSAISGRMGIGGVVLLLAEPLDGCRTSASNDSAAWIRDMQLREDMGPLPNALRTGRTMLTADITRVGPPAMAAAAAECGLVSSLVVPFEVEDGERIGALQLLGEAYRAVEPADADLLRPLLEVLAARLADVKDLQQASVARPSSSIDGAGVLIPFPRNDAALGDGTVVRRPEPGGELQDTGESSPAEATAPALPARVTLAPAASSTTPRAFVPRPSPTPRSGRHSL